ncbi:hypothetical protein JW949_01140 [Candidatus Woesearchaeota archaeon]|nr:hypothetical protein [Candidatus Woesearchaeota archaeon]
MKNNKAQISQLFIYIFIIVIVGAILMIGYKSINNFISKGCDVEKITFKEQTESLINKYNDYGSYHEERINAPCSFSKVCFVNTSTIGKPVNYEDLTIKTSVMNGVEKNIFLIGDYTSAVGYVDLIYVDDEEGTGVICFNAQGGNFYIGFEGMGKSTKIVEIQE